MLRNVARRIRNGAANRLVRPISILGRDFKEDEMTNVTPRIASKLGLQKHLSPMHPVEIIKKEIYSFFDNNYRKRGMPIFTQIDHLSPVVTIEQNFDSVLVPEDHVARDKKDNYYINKEMMLRAHTSAHQVDLLKSGLNAFLCTGDVYRRDTIDRSHYPIFHQMEGLRIFSKEELFDYALDINEKELFSNGRHIRTDFKQERHSVDAKILIEKNLKETLEALVKHLFGQDVEYRWIDAYFPFTHPSWEIEVFYDNDWLEVLGCGIIEQEVLDNGGVQQKVGWAFGLGLERLAMRLFNVNDIRVFWSENEKIKEQFDNFDGNYSAFEFKDPKLNIEPKPFDTAFWITEGFNENDFYDIARSCDNDDIIEHVQLVDQFTHPKTGKTSHCYRTFYRGLLKGTSFKDIEHIDAAIRNALVENGVTLR